ncbi:prolyl 3,4-dihydroxylase Tpa1p [Monosporozyma servazzii]
MSKRSNENQTDLSSKQHVSEDEKASLLFNPKLWTKEFKDDMKSTILNNKPFEWGCIDDLVDDQLLRDIRTEVETQIQFTEKETDIYKVNQSGDLANLSNLDSETLQRLPNLFKLQQILYSNKFRDFMSYITQSGPLSNCKVDLSVNTYKKGCHLLVHDDVIGSRRISFIIYLPDPNRKWKDHYGGGLRLFPTVDFNIPHSDPVAKLVPQFNQFAFFKIQPGYSWHDVEEVKVDKHRLSIQGWYHIPQEADLSGFIPGEEKSWLKQNDSLVDTDMKNFTFPSIERPLLTEDTSSIMTLTNEDNKYLSKYLSSYYLKSETINQLKDKFLTNSFISIEDFLNDEMSSSLQKLIKYNELNEPIPTKLEQVEQPWDLARPPHKWQFLYLNGDDSKSELNSELIKLKTFFQSLQFKKYILKITDLLPMTQDILVRRFRPGFDYTLADTPDLNKKIDDLLECILEGTLSLTPFDGWINEGNGGYQLYMLNEAELREDQVSGNDSILINKPASWNSFNLVMRDAAVLEFIKYVGFNSKGSRWDVKMSWDVKDTQEDSEDEE